MDIQLKILEESFAVCRLKDFTSVNLQSFTDKDTVFLARTSEEFSLVCSADRLPENTTHIDTGWKALKIQGILDFSLIGIIAGISAILAENKIGIFVVSTYNTDYILIKEEQLDRAVALLKENGYKF